MSDNLPESMIMEIICRLPVESILRCRCVSKHFRSLISTPDFISAQLSYSLSPAATSTPLILLRRKPYDYETPSEEQYCIYIDPPPKSETLTHVKDLAFPFKPISGGFIFSIVGFCNGLFCLTDDTSECTNLTILWNPAIRKSLFLPMPHFSWSSYGPHTASLGFGFDPKTQDFKVVRFFYQKTTLEIEMYTLSTGLWTRLSSEGIRCSRVQGAFGTAYVNAAIHWLSYCNNKPHHKADTNGLLVFNLTDETFCEMDLPHDLLHVEVFDLTVTLCGDLLSVIWYENGRHCRAACDRLVIWVMNDYGKMESWTRKYVVVFDDGIRHGIGFLSSGEFLLKSYDQDLLSYDPNNKEFKDLELTAWQDSFFLSKYVESLVLVDGRGGATADTAEGIAGRPQLNDARKELELCKKLWNTETVIRGSW